MGGLVPPNPAELLTAAQAAAKDERIPLIGPSPPGVARPARERLAGWLAAGCHGDMAWIAESMACRSDPTVFWPPVRSVLVCGVPYSGAPAGPPPRVAGYARGRDYHRVLGAALNRILNRLREWFPGVNGRVCVDTSPLLERTLAVQAGLGWLGRNGCLIHPCWGSRLLLGVILLNVPLPTAEQLSGDCGECRRCREACPTGAFRPSGVVDSRLCVSYLTVESRDSIPAGLLGRLGGWLFGCDTCQEVCPHNRLPLGLGWPELTPGLDTEALQAERLVTMSGKSFLRQYGRSPLARARLDGLLRNLTALLPELPGHPGLDSLRAAGRRFPLVAAQWRELERSGFHG